MRHIERAKRIGNKGTKSPLGCQQGQPKGLMEGERGKMGTLLYFGYYVYSFNE